MKDNYITLKEDLARLINIFESETEGGKDKTLTIFSSKDKGLPDNPIVYHHHDSINELAKGGLLSILEVSNHIDETSPNFSGPFYYRVVIDTQKVKETIKASNTVTKLPPDPLPTDVRWNVSEKKALLEFKDKKKN